MNGLRNEYLQLVQRWNELSLLRERLLGEVSVFVETRGSAVSEGEAEFRRRLDATIEESFSVAYRAQQIAQLPDPFGRLRRRRRMLKAQQLWFSNIKGLSAMRAELGGMRL